MVIHLINSDLFCGIGVHGISDAAIPAVRETWATILGASSVGERILCKYNRIGRRKDTQICTVARETGKAS